MAEDLTGSRGSAASSRDLSARLAEIAAGADGWPTEDRLEAITAQAVAAAVPAALAAALPGAVADALAHALPPLVGDAVGEAVAQADPVGGVDDGVRAEIDALRVDIANALEYVRESVLTHVDTELGAAVEASAREGRRQSETVAETVSAAVTAALEGTLVGRPTGPSVAGFEQEVDALRVDLANALDFLRRTVEERTAASTDTLLAALLELRTDVAVTGAESLTTLAEVSAAGSRLEETVGQLAGLVESVQAGVTSAALDVQALGPVSDRAAPTGPELALREVRDALLAQRTELDTARAAVAAIGERVQVAGRWLVTYLAERDARLEEVRDKAVGQLLTDVLASLPAGQRSAAAEQTRGRLGRRREARDAERWRALRADTGAGVLPGGSDEDALRALLGDPSPRDLDQLPTGEPTEASPRPSPTKQAAAKRTATTRSETSRTAPNKPTTKRTATKQPAAKRTAAKRTATKRTATKPSELSSEPPAPRSDTTPVDTAPDDTQTAGAVTGGGVTGAATEVGPHASQQHAAELEAAAVAAPMEAGASAPGQPPASAPRDSVPSASGEDPQP